MSEALNAELEIFLSQNNDSSLSVGGYESHLDFSFFSRRKEQTQPITDQQKNIVDEINRRIKQDGHATYRDRSTGKLSSVMFEQIEDLSKLEVKLDGGFVDSNGKYKNKYKSTSYRKSTCYTGFEMLSILRKIEYLESLVDTSLPLKDQAKQTYEIIARHFCVFNRYDEKKNRYLFKGLRGITYNNVLCSEQFDSIGYAQLYKELCNRLGISCEIVSGVGKIKNNSFRHAWNVVLLEGAEIPVDCAWHSSDSKDWFDVSDEFKKTHIADEDEFYRDYSAKKKKSPKNEKILHIITTMDSRSGVGSGVYGLVRYLATEEDNSITRCDGAREMLHSLSASDIESFLQEMDRDVLVGSVMSYLKDQMIQKYGSVEGLKQFHLFLKTKDSSYITRSEGARDVANKWLKDEDIELYSTLD